MLLDSYKVLMWSNLIAEFSYVQEEPVTHRRSFALIVLKVIKL